MDSSLNQLPLVIHENEADEDLELNTASNLQTCLAEFTAKGGTIIRLEGDTEPFRLKRYDVVYPSCSGANNRSQTLWRLLSTFDGAIRLQQPHATRYGFDPYNGKVNWNRTHHIQKDDQFKLWAGVNKSKKFGWHLFQDWLERDDASESDLSMMTEYYNTHYYNPGTPENIRRIYITFAKNAHAHLYRLNQTNASLQNVFVLFYPLEDTIAHPLPDSGIQPRSIEAYEDLASKISKYLDCSQLISF